MKIMFAADMSFNYYDAFESKEKAHISMAVCFKARRGRYGK